MSKSKKKMYRCIKQDLIHLEDWQYRELKYFCHIAKDLYNQGLYNVRQEYFANKRKLSYTENYRLLKDSTNYKKLNSHISISILRKLDDNMESFFQQLKAKKENKSKGKKNKGKVRLPGYLPKKGYCTIEIPNPNVRNGKLLIPVSNTFKKNRPNASKIEIQVPPILDVEKLKVVRIIPQQRARFITLEYIYTDEPAPEENDRAHAIGVDLGVKNLMTCATNRGQAWIIDGKGLKGIISYYDYKINSLKQARDLELYAKDPQGSKYVKKRMSEQMKQLYHKRDNEIRNYISKAARMLIDKCRELKAGTLVVGYNDDFQIGSDMDEKANRVFMKIPFGKLVKRLEDLCEQYGILYIEQEESYTSQASFFDFDFIPVYGEEGANEVKFSGVREKRGRYVRNNGQVLNADYNAALNIMRKCNYDCKAVFIQEDLDKLCLNGSVVVPERIRVL